MSVLFGIPVDLAYHLVCWLAAILAPLLGGFAAAAAIVAFTMLIRLGLLPLGYLAFRGEKARNRLLPQMQDLQRRHARDPERLRAEMAALQRAEGAGLFAGCLPLLRADPVLFRDVPAVPVPLGGRCPQRAPRAPAAGRVAGQPVAGRGGPFSPQGLVFAVLFALLAGVALLAVRAARRAAPDRRGGQPQRGRPGGGGGHRPGPRPPRGPRRPNAPSASSAACSRSGPW